MTVQPRSMFRYMGMRMFGSGRVPQTRAAKGGLDKFRAKKLEKKSATFSKILVANRGEIAVRVRHLVTRHANNASLQ